MSHRGARAWLAAAALLAGPQLAAPVQAEQLPGTAEVARRLLAAYPGHLARVEGDVLVWQDSTRMPLDDGKGRKDFEALLTSPDIKDMFAQPYPAGGPATAPAERFDPGRFRNQAFFDKMYGDCAKGEVKPKLAPVDWLPQKRGGRLMVTTVNGVDAKLKAVSDELDRLPAEFDRFLVPSAGVYACRTIAGTNLRSVHSYGAAIDINADAADYWRWSKAGAEGGVRWRNRVPIEIVRVFEKHGFIWGGRWHHYDTMHFEYRPELLAR